MKSASSISLSKSWWKKEAPDGLKKSGTGFEKALDEHAKADGALAKAKPEAAISAFESALSALASAGKSVAAEAKDLEKKEKDKKKKADLANTQAVMGKPLAKAIEAERKKLEALEEAVAAGDFGTPEAHKAFLQKWAPKIKRGQISFAIGLPSNKPEEMRFNFHMTKDPRGLANPLKKHANAKKFTFGKAGTLALAEAHGEEDATTRTLCLYLEGRRIPGLAKRVRLMLKKLGVSQFGKVRILEGGVEVDGADEDDEDETIQAFDLDAPDEPAGAGNGADPDPMPAAAPPQGPQPEPEPEPQPDAGSAPAATIAAAPAPPVDAKALQARYVAIYPAIKRMMGGMEPAEAAMVKDALQGYGKAMKSGDPARALALIEALEDRAEGSAAKLAALTGGVGAPLLDAGAAGNGLGPLMDAGSGSQAPAQEPTMFPEFNKVPAEIRNLFPYMETGGPIAPELVDRTLGVADRLEDLSQEDRAELLGMLPVGPAYPEIMLSILEGLLWMQSQRASAAAEIKLAKGSLSGTSVAELGGRGARIPVKLGEKASVDFGSAVEAIAMARRLKTSAAVMTEDGRYTIYVVRDGAWFAQLYHGTVENHLTKPSENPTDTMLIRKHRALQTLITRDDIVVDMRAGAGELQRAGGDLDPFDAHLAAYGVGLELVADREEFLKIFVLAMRDTAHVALNASEAELKREQKKYAGSETTPEQDAIIRKACATVSRLEDEIEKQKQMIKALEGERDKDLQRIAGRTPGLLGVPRPGAVMDTYTYNILGPGKRFAEQISVHRREIYQREQQRLDAAKPFPLVLQFNRDQRAKLMAPSAGGKTSAIQAKIAELHGNIVETRRNVVSGSLEMWTVDKVRDAAVAGLALKPEKALWVREHARKVREDKAKRSIALAALSIGLAIGAAFATGGVALFLAGAAFTVGVIDAVETTQDRFVLGAAANITINPTDGLISQDDVPHWGWVAVAWAGVVLDAGDVAKAIKVLKTARLEKGVRTAGEIRQLTDAELDVAARTLRPQADAEELMRLRKALADALAGRKVSEFNPAVIPERVFDREYGDAAAEAVTLIKKNKDGTYKVEILVRDSVDGKTRDFAVAEEIGHLRQINDPAYADDVAKLTEDQLSKGAWAVKSDAEKLEAFRAQRRLERDLQKDRVVALEARRQEIQDTLGALPEWIANGGGTTDDLRRAQLALRDVEYDLGDARGALETYTREFDEIQSAIAGGTRPAFLDWDVAPRLFNTSQTGKNNKAAIDLLDLRDAAGNKINPENLKDAGWGFRRQYADDANPGNYTLAKQPDFDPSTGKHYRVADHPDGYKFLQEFTPDPKELKKSVAQRRAELELQFRDPLTNFAKVEDAIQGYTPYQQAYARSYRRPLRAMSDGLPIDVPNGGRVTIPGLDMGKVFKEIDDAGGAALSPNKYEEMLRRALRAEIVKHVQTHVDAEHQILALKAYKKLMPNNAARGELFTHFRAANMAEEAAALPGVTGPVRTLQSIGKTGEKARKSGDLTIKGTKFRGDGIMDVAIDDAVKNHPRFDRLKGPKEAGEYLLEDKSSLAAFEVAQLKHYSEALKSADGLMAKTDRPFQGVAYVFPSALDAKAAKKEMHALSKLNEPDKLSDAIHLGYYVGDKIKWIR